MHTTIKVENFRSIKSAVFSIHPGLNVLVGPNGSGKTNLLHALKFLSNIVVHGAALAMGKAGGPSRNLRRDEKEIRFVVVSEYGKYRYKGSTRNMLIRWEIDISLSSIDQIVQIKSESVRIVTGIADAVEEIVIVEIARTSAGVLRSRTWVADEELLTKNFFERSAWASSNVTKADLFKRVRAGLTDSLKDAKKFPQDASIIDRISGLGPSLRKMQSEISLLDEYNIQPDVARKSTDPLPVTRMGNDGSGVSEVIHALETRQFRRFFAGYGYFGSNYSAFRDYRDHQLMVAMTKGNPLEEIVENLKAGVNSIDSISTEFDPSTGRRFIVFQSGEHKFRPDEVSDGTMKWLCLLVALLVPRSRVILLEEPENFMHPWMLQRFVGLIREQAKKTGVSVLMSSHSATILNSILVDELSLVRQENGSTVIEVVYDKESVQELLRTSKFGLGDIWVSGGIESILESPE
jgi:AAA15 family ATPase/GTPase